MNSTEAAWSYEDGAIDTVCELCLKPAPCILTIDPFVDEIHGEQTPEEYWCLPCWGARKDDV